MRTCRHCEDEFDERSQMKQEVGENMGNANHKGKL